MSEGFSQMTDLAKLMGWVAGDDTGISSKCIAAVMCGAQPEQMDRKDAPYDPHDLGRCLRLLELFPEWKARMPEMAKISERWAIAVEHWDELTELFVSEVGSPLERAKWAPLTAKRMKQIGL
jgi:hypothetical protein